VGQRKVAIVGGGMAALAAAFELTRTPELCARHQVTIYQMGWRLGGKGATGRDKDHRIVEHGLHIWFGFYENAFALVKAAYNEWNPPSDQAIKRWDDALLPQCSTAIGNGDSSDFIRLEWPAQSGSPGDGQSDLSLWRCIAQLIAVIGHFYGTVSADAPEVERFSLDTAVMALIDIADVQHGTPPFKPIEVLTIARRWAERLNATPELQTCAQARGIVALLRSTATHLLAAAGLGNSRDEFLAQLVDVGSAVIGGVVFDMLIAGRTIAELDRMDFREWLSLNGAARDSVYRSRVVRALYDSLFQYCEGDHRRPSYAAGTAAQAVLRLYGTYQQAFAFKMQAGMGEVVVAPIYGVLQRRGVGFQFFHKLKRIELTPGKDAVARLHFARQVWLKVRDKPYEPTLPPCPENGNLLCWPDSPRWEQIENGDSLRQLDLESHWCSQEVEEVTLQRGATADFDDVILAVPLGVFKKLNDAPGPCDELIAASDRFRAMTENQRLVPSISVQAWCTRDLEELGWDPQGPTTPDGASRRIELPATSTGPRPLDIWADMSQVLAFEPWKPSPEGPKSLHYLCDVLATELYRAPPDSKDVPERAKKLARALAVHWFNEKARFPWPKSMVAGRFDWSILFAPPDLSGSKRIEAQVVRANVDPVGCCVGSPAGSTEWRMKTRESGFAHLYLAGSWIDSGFNTECIEAAVMSGMQASRAVSGSPAQVHGEHFLHRRLAVGLAEFFALLIEGAFVIFSLCEDVIAACGAVERSRRLSSIQRPRRKAQG
jgi:uncharacterized protein with NAD-binding domain and iron-sulfur cluster